MKYAAIPLHLKGNMLLNIICMEQGPWHSTVSAMSGAWVSECYLNMIVSTNTHVNQP